MNNRSKIKNSLTIAMFAALMAAGAFIRIPVGPVPITLTSFFVLMAALLLGPVGGSLSVIIYLLIGITGLPAFAGGSGPAVFAGPTGGFLIGYILTTLVCGFISAGSTDIAEKRCSGQRHYCCHRGQHCTLCGRRPLAEMEAGSGMARGSFRKHAAVSAR